MTTRRQQSQENIASAVAMVKRLYLIAGANGSGKSTIARELLPSEGLQFINPDDIARELNPASPEKVKVAAGREALRRINSFFADGISFAIETTLSGLVHVKTLDHAKELGYETTLIYVFVDSPEVCIARIAARVKHGGHFIPDADVRRRYIRSKRNFLNVYAPLAGQWTLFYNGASQTDMVARKDFAGRTTVFSESLYSLLRREYDMNEWDARLLAIANRAVRRAQDENRRLGIPNVYSVNGTLLWQMPDGSITTVNPMRSDTPNPPFVRQPS